MQCIHLLLLIHVAIWLPLFFLHSFCHTSCLILFTFPFFCYSDGVFRYLFFFFFSVLEIVLTVFFLLVITLHVLQHCFEIIADLQKVARLVQSIPVYLLPSSLKCQNFIIFPLSFFFIPMHYFSWSIWR